MKRIKGDNIVNQALDSRIERESNWKRKYSTTCKADKVFQENIEKAAIVKPTTENETGKSYLFTKLQKQQIKQSKKIHLNYGTIK